MNNIKFEKVSRFMDVDLPLPKRGTGDSAGYDFVVAENFILPPYDWMMNKVRDHVMSKNPNLDLWGFNNPFSLDDIAAINKELKTKLPLVSTGMKCKMPSNIYLELSVRSSTPLKHWIMLGNSVGVIDSDYYNNPNNEGEIFAQLINLAPFAIQLKRGDKIIQGIFHEYHTTENDEAFGQRIGGFGSTGDLPVFPDNNQSIWSIWKIPTQSGEGPNWVGERPTWIGESYPPPYEITCSTESK